MLDKGNKTKREARVDSRSLLGKNYSEEKKWKKEKENILKDRNFIFCFSWKEK